MLLSTGPIRPFVSVVGMIGQRIIGFLVIIIIIIIISRVSSLHRLPLSSECPFDQAQVRALAMPLGSQSMLIIERARCL